MKETEHSKALEIFVVVVVFLLFYNTSSLEKENEKLKN